MKLLCVLKMLLWVVKIDIDEMLENARKIRQLTAENTISEEEFSRAKAEGRI